MTDDTERTLRSDQKLLPLFALATALGIVGYVSAFRTPGADATRTDRKRAGGAEVGTTEDIDSQPSVLEYRAGSGRRLAVAFRQGRSEDGALSTRIDLTIDESRAARPGGERGVQYRRRYDEVDIRVDEGESAVGPRITEQVESMVLGVESVVEVNRIGAVQRSEWTALSNPQVRQTLRIFRRAVLLLLPRPRRGSVAAGDAWSWRIGAEHLESRHLQEVDGNVRVRERLVRYVRRGGRRQALIERDFEMRATGRARPEEAAEARRFEMTGDGSGRAWFDVAAGTVTESRLEMRRTLTFEGDDGRSSVESDIEWSLRELGRGERPSGRGDAG